MSSVQTKLIALGQLEVLKKKADRALQNATELYERYFNKEEWHHPVFKTGDWVYINKPSNLTEGKSNTGTEVIIIIIEASSKESRTLYSAPGEKPYSYSRRQWGTQRRVRRPYCAG